MRIENCTSLIQMSIGVKDFSDKRVVNLDPIFNNDLFHLFHQFVLFFAFFDKFVHKIYHFLKR